MNEFAAALGGTATAIIVGAVMVGRSWPVPSGRHRAGDTLPAPLLRPVEALNRVEAYCPVQDRPTLQLRLTTGGTCCSECRHTTPPGEQ